MTWKEKDIPDLDGKTILITGPTSGIGLEALQLFVAHRARVIIAARNAEKAATIEKEVLAAYPDAKVFFVYCDLTSFKTISECAVEVQMRFPELHVLLCNAGIMHTPKRTTEDGFDEQFQSNHLGHFLLVGLLLRRLMETPRSRIVCVSSAAHTMARAAQFGDLNSEREYNTFRVYGLTKLANIMFVLELQKRLESVGMGTRETCMAIACHPGWSKTNLHAYDKKAPTRAFWAVTNVVMAQKARKGAWPSVYAATHHSVRGGDYIGPSVFFEFWGTPEKVQPRGLSHNQDLRELLWNESVRMTKVNYSELEKEELLKVEEEEEEEKVVDESFDIIDTPKDEGGDVQ